MTRSAEVEVRPEKPDDHRVVYEIVMRAFGSRGEADLVEALRGVVEPQISLVALYEGRLAGHIFFGPVTVESAPPFEAVGLAPLAVSPEFQNRGIGSELVRVGLEECRRARHPIVFVLGHPTYYPRFGFARAAPMGLRYEAAASEEAFMVAELVPDALHGRRGWVRYDDAFDRV